MLKLFLDIETRCAKSLRDCGSFAYAEKAEVLLVSYAVNDAPAKVWDKTSEPEPRDLYDAFVAVDKGEGCIIMHNGMMFDSVILRIDPRKVVDTMVLAYQAGIGAASLGDLCTVLGVPQDKSKDKRGSWLIRHFCQPRPDGSWFDARTNPVEWEEFKEYARLDVEAMREVYKRLPKPNNTAWEREMQLLDAEINRRGICIDKELVTAALTLWEEEKDNLSRELSVKTNGVVKTGQQRDALLTYIKEFYGFTLDNLTKAEVAKRLDDENLPAEVRELLAIRVKSAKNAAAKYQRLWNYLTEDGRLRGTLQFRGACRTGRMSGRGPQFHNLPRPTMPADEIDEAIDMVKSHVAAMVYDDVGEVLNNCLRGTIIASPGNKLIVADYSNIEGRVLAWLAGEDWKVKAFRDFDNGIGHDLYKMTYARTFGIRPEDVTKAQRQVGKVLELALGYGGGAGAFATFASAYRVDLDAMADEVQRSIDPKLWREAAHAYETMYRKYDDTGLGEKVFIACDAIKRAWRLANPKIVRLWTDVGSAVEAAIGKPHAVEMSRGMSARRHGKYLWLTLPSGRVLSYPRMHKEDDTLVYEGVNQYTRKWGKIKTYGAKLCIAKGTPVLTNRGWVAIECVTSHDLVWDGTTWRKQGGALYKGTKNVMQLDGVWITPDHKVLVCVNGKDEWRCANEASEFNRVRSWLPESYRSGRDGRSPLAVANKMCMRARSHFAGIQVAALCKGWHMLFLRLQKAGNDSAKTASARYVAPSGFRCVALYERALRMRYAQGVQKLRRAWDSSMRTMVEILRGVLGGYGPYVAQGAYAGPNKQRWELRAVELPLGDTQRASKQSKENHLYRWKAFDLLGAEERYRANNDFVPIGKRMPERTSVRQTGCYEEVFDLIDVETSHRFVVRGSTGETLIVHNCENVVQGIACDILMEGMLALNKNGYTPVLSVHDEVVLDVPDNDGFNYKTVQKIMTQPPGWATGLPLAVDGYEAKRYHK